jgi:hypothetical protein
MYTNNTIKNSLAKLSAAIEQLEVITHDLNIPIISFLKSITTADFIQLKKGTNFPDALLQEQLITLEKVGILQIYQEEGIRYYSLDQYKLLRIQLLTKQLIEEPVGIFNS